MISISYYLKVFSITFLHSHGLTWFHVTVFMLLSLHFKSVLSRRNSQSSFESMETKLLIQNREAKIENIAYEAARRSDEKSCKCSREFPLAQIFKAGRLRDWLYNMIDFGAVAGLSFDHTNPE